ncbi:von Willebrand factor type A [Xylanimonas cellulosilytica DSM 15894]|uniref:von Willebrand factor type A n=1 Tax=Xylanimonas cellulosilytica (strain DSM 15894 / JCM 12276 / CECT 5975 / KCTC 9989 / LMG 20990 / NBRC 107835 / XIL07) TaxID=446471 RepID=D1BU25_XYLCX|nr:VWA domain-containing protein [Xylanimonas cellulosilytica]ACZ29189.1 von Willebrand factor type A [Xylanimonas cellulosilytica DSM 15894]
MAPRTKFSIRRTPVLRRIAAATVALAIVSGGAIASQAAAEGEGADGQIVATVDGVPVTQAELEELIGQETGERSDADDDGGERVEGSSALAERPDTEESSDADGHAADPTGPGHHATGVPAPPEDDERVIAPKAGTTNINVRVGGDRTNANNNLTVEPVAGVTLGLFSSRIGGEPVHVAVSGTDGYARFTGLEAGGYYWLRGVSAPAGWTLNDTFATASLTSDPAQVTGRTYAFRVPESGTLTANRTYASGTDFMRTRTTSGTGEARFESSTGYFAVSRENPGLPTVCSALNIALILDRSASINTPELQATVRNAAKEFVDLLDGSQVSMEIFAFGTTAGSLTGNASHNLAGPDSAQYLRNAITNGLGSSSDFSGQYTNWDDALWKVSQRGGFDLAIVFTDGLPTVFGNPASTASNGSALTRFAENERAVFAANALKDQGTRVISVGVGPIVGEAAVSVPNLVAISSDDAVITAGWESAAGALRDAILHSCTPHLTVQKYTVPWHWASGDSLAEHRAGAGWTFTASELEGTDGTFETMSGEERTTESSGSTTWFFSPSHTGTVGSVTITETQQEGYQLVQQDGANAVCTQAVAEGTPSDDLHVTNRGDLGFNIGHIGSQDAITCQVINRRPGPVSVSGLAATGVYDVDHTWDITKQVRADAASGWVDETTLSGVAPGGQVDVEYRLVVTAERAEAHRTTSVSFDVTRPVGSTVGTQAVRVTVDGTEVYRRALSEFPMNQTTPVALDGLVVPGGEPATVALYVGDVLIQSTVVDSELGTTTNATAELTDTFVEPFADVTAFADAFGAVTLDATLRQANYTDHGVAGASVTNPAEDGPLTWRFVYPATLDGPERPGDEVTAVNTAVVSPADDGLDAEDEATVVITTDPVGPRVVVDASAAYSTDYVWTIDKQVRVAGADGPWLDAAEARTIPGAGVEFEYRLVVRAAGTSTNPVMTGHVVLHNDNASPLTLAGSLVVEAGGVEQSIDVDGTMIAPAGSTTVGVEISPAHPAAWPITVTATYGDSAGSVGVVPDVVVTNATAVVTDTFAEFEEAFPVPESELDAQQPTNNEQWDDAEGVWVFTYTAVRGEQVAAGASDDFVNTATVTPGDAGPSDEDDAIVTVRTGLPLAVVGDGDGTLVRTYGWELVKQVQDVTGAWVDAATLPADDDGNAEFTFRVVVRPASATDSDWEFTGSAEIHNPNDWTVTARNVTATISGAGIAPVDVALENREIGAGQTVQLDLTAILAEVDYWQFDAVDVSIAWEQDEAFSVTTSDSVTIAVEWDADHAPVNRVVNVYDDLAGTVDAPVRLGTVDWSTESADDVADVPEGVVVTMVDGAFHFTYTVTVAAEDGALSTSSHNRAWLTSGGEDGEDGALPPIAEDATEQTVIRYDLALRTWVNEIWRDGVQVHEVTDAALGGPADPIPFTAYDADEDVRVGDVLVKPIVVINQGDERARVTEIVHWLPDAALELASSGQAREAGQDNSGWGESQDGRVATLILAEPLDLAPGEWGRVDVTLTVVADPDAEDSTDGQVHANAIAFAEVAAFEGWVPAGTSYGGTAEDAASEGLFTRIGRFIAGIFADDAETGGAWTSTAVDVDSAPNTADHLTDGEWDADAIAAIWAEIDNVVTGATGAVGVPHAADSDDHDGEIVRVLVGLPLEAAVTVSGTNHVDHDWAITKVVTSDDDVETVAGEDVEFAYLLTVTSERQVESLEVSGHVSVANPSSVAVALDALSVTIGDESAVLDGVVTSVPGGGAVDVPFTATLDGNLVDDGLPLPVVATVVSLPDGQEATETNETELTLDDVTRTITNQTAEVRDSFPEFAVQLGDANGEVWLDAADPAASEAWNAEAGRWQFAYTAERGATVPDGGIESFVNVATVIPDPGTPPGVDWEDDQSPGDLEDDAVVIVRTPVVYDLALRSWVAELHRPGVGRISERLPSDLYPDTSGPEQPVPYVTYDNPYADVQVGDIMVSNIRVFNQGNRTARVDELVKYTYPGLALASPSETAVVPAHPNDGWAIGESGDAYRTFADGGIVLAPGEEFTIHVTQVVTSELFEEDGVEVVYDDDGRPFREVLTFTEISAFSGWVHDEPVIAAGDPLIRAFATGEVHDGADGSWVTAEPGGLVEDIDSIPGTADHRVPFDETSVRWVDMEIHHSVGEQDEDDHDGAVIRILDPEFVANELPAPAPDVTPTPDGTPGPNGTPDPDATPDLDATDPDVRAATGGTVLDGGGRVLLALAAAGLALLAGLVLRRTRNSRESSAGEGD